MTQGTTPTVEPSLAADTPAPPSHTGVPASTGGATSVASERLVSLDAFRGATILGMLLVNNMALDQATPRHLTHAPWNQGVHFADLVFPWFLLIVGVAIPYSAASARRRQLRGLALAGKVLGRTVSLFLLGCLLDSSVAHRPMLGLGVLQLIGLAAAAGTLLYGLPLPARLPTALALLAGHWAAIRFVAVPGLEAGAFEEGANLIQYLNANYLQELGLKGIISVVPTTALVLLGTALGDLLRRPGLTPWRKTAWLLVAGALATAAGWAWSLDLPFNKPVWTAPYILFAAGLGGIGLSLCYLVLDACRLPWLGFPLVVLGSNAIVAYVAPILVKVHALQEWTWSSPGGPVTLQQALLTAATEQFGRITGGWVYTAGYILAWWLVLWVLQRRRLFFRV